MTTMRRSRLRYFLLLLLLQFLHTPTTASFPGIVRVVFVCLFFSLDQSTAALAAIENDRELATAVAAAATNEDRVALAFIKEQLTIAMSACTFSFCSFDCCSFNWWDYVLCRGKFSVCT
jgi:hypothetical protein